MRAWGKPCGKMEGIMEKLDYVQMGMRIRQVRKAKGWSQSELAKKCGISMSFLGHIERGTRIMSLETFASICTELEARADELLWGMASTSDVVLELLALSGDKEKKDIDNYTMYIKIMKSVAEIMNEA